MGTVLFASYSGVLGGAERLLLDAAGGLEEPPVLACPEGGLAARARAAGVHVLALPERTLDVRAAPRQAAAHAAGLAAHAGELHRLARDLDARLVVAWGMRSALACAGARLARPWTFQHNDFVPAELRRPVRAAARSAGRVLALSRAVAGDLGVPARVILPGVDLDAFPARPLPPPGGPAEVLVLGALVPWKRPELALEAVALAARDRPDLRLTFAGAAIGLGPSGLPAALRRRAQAPDLAGRVRFAGRVADVRPALESATCLLHCADREPFGIALAEALAAGRPVVAPDAGGPREIVDGSCGRRFAPGDARAAARALLAVLADPEPLAAAGRRRAEERFDVRRVREAYRRELGEAGGRAAARPVRNVARAPVAGLGDAGRSVPAFVTVTRNSAFDLRRLLGSLRAHLPGAEVVVVDNGSADDSVAVARGAGAEVVALGENRGFGAAANEGVARARAPVTVLANPDLEVVDDSLGHLAAAAAPDALLAPLLLLPDGRRQDVAQHLPGTRAEVAIAALPPAALPASLRRRIQPWTARRPTRAGWPVGACVVAATATLRRLGPFDPELFLYAEDLDLGLRAAAAGVATWFRPDARAIHHQGHAARAAFGGEPFERLARARAAVIERRCGRAARRRDEILQAATFANRILLKALARRSTARERAQLRALRRATR